MLNLKKNFYYQLLAVISFCLFFTKNAYAYIDPGTGNYFIQAIIGVLMGSIITIKLYWRSIVGFFKRLLKPRK